MAPLPTSAPERTLDENQVLGRLLGLYEEERQIYGRVLELSRRQGDIVRRGGSLAEIRRLLEQKKRCLDTVRRLELTERESKSAWEQGQWTSGGRARLHAALARVTDLIEEVLACEENNDMDLIARTQVV